MPEIRLEDVSVSYTGKDKTEVIVLNDFNATFSSGGFHVILGYSGCGKTTLLRTIAGFMNYEGKIFFNSAEIVNTPLRKRNISYVSQEYVLYPNMTIFDNIAFPLNVAGAKREEVIARVNAIAQELDLQYCLARRPKHLSGGQQQRVAVARALIRKPSVCLLDEPLSNVDAQQRVNSRILIKKALKNSGCTVIYVTHDFREAMALADTIYVMDGGKIIVSGTPTEVYGSADPVVNSLKDLNIE